MKSCYFGQREPQSADKLAIGILLLVQYTMKPETRQAFVDEMNASGILQKIREEEGYVSYNYYFDVAEADKLLLVEEWASEDKQRI